MITESEAKVKAIQHWYIFGPPKLMIPEDSVFATKIRDMDSFYEVSLQIENGFHFMNNPPPYNPDRVIAVAAVDKETGKIIWFVKEQFFWRYLEFEILKSMSLWLLL